MLGILLVSHCPSCKWDVELYMVCLDQWILVMIRQLFILVMQSQGGIFGWITLWVSEYGQAYIDGLVQERCNTSALAKELRLLALTHRYCFISYKLLLCLEYREIYQTTINHAAHHLLSAVVHSIMVLWSHPDIAFIITCRLSVQIDIVTTS